MHSLKGSFGLVQWFTDSATGGSGESTSLYIFPMCILYVC